MLSINPFTGFLWMVQAQLWGSLSKAGADIVVESWVSEFCTWPRFGHLPYLPICKMKMQKLKCCQWTSSTTYQSWYWWEVRLGQVRLRFKGSHLQTMHLPRQPHRFSPCRVPACLGLRKAEQEDPWNGKFWPNGPAPTIFFKIDTRIKEDINVNNPILTLFYNECSWEERPARMIAVSAYEIHIIIRDPGHEYSVEKNTAV